MNIDQNKQKFIDLLRSTGRTGVDNVIEQLETLGFFTAPASTKFHLDEEGGLLQHSLNVCTVAMTLRSTFITLNPEVETMLPLESVIISALLHDACKADVYKTKKIWSEDVEGKRVKIPSYVVDYSNLPLGHGEKSVIFLLRAGLKLTDDEMIAIRWHMDSWDLPFQSYDLKGNLNAAKAKSPLATLIHTADGVATHIVERKG